MIKCKKSLKLQMGQDRPTTYITTNSPARPLGIAHFQIVQRAKSVNYNPQTCQTAIPTGKIINHRSFPSRLDILIPPHSLKRNSSSSATKLTSEALSEIPNGPDNRSAYISHDESHELLSLGIATTRRKDSRAQELAAWETYFQSLSAERWGREGR